MVVLMLVAIAFSLLYIFMFYTSGLIILELFKFKIKNYFMSVAVGFFVYFAFISICIFPLQLISLLPYIFFIYYIIAISIIYLLFCFVFMRFWLNTNFFKLDSLIYILVVLLMLGIDYFSHKYICKENFSSHKNTLAILYWLKDNPVSFFNEATLFNFLGFKPFQGWYTFQISIIVITNVQPYNYKDIIIPMMRLVDAFLIASIFISFYESFGLNFKTKNRIIIFCFSFIIFILTRMVFWKLKYSIYSGEMTLLYLILFSTSMLLRYTSFNNRERYNPILIGIILGGYISFSWDSSYQILFLLYSFIFAIQKRFRKNFTKDILKISLFSMIGFVFYNITLKLYVQAIIFGAITFLMFFSAYLLNKNYSFVLRFEKFLEDKSIFTVFLVPSVFMILSIAFLLAFNESLISDKNNKLNILFIWLSIIKNDIAKQSITFIASMILLIGSIVWIFFRKKIKCDLITNVIDLFFISYLTFYNPISVRFINIFYPKMFETNGMVMLILIFITINSIPYSFKTKNKVQINQEVKVIKKYSRLTF